MNNELEISVRFSETDAMGVVYHGNFYSWFEMGRYDLVEKYCENSRKELKFGKIYLPVVKAECSYHDFIKFGEKIILSTYLVKTDTAKLRFISEIRKKGSKRIAAKGYTEHVFVDEKYKLLVQLPECIKKDMVLIEENYPEYLLNEEQRKGR